MQRKYSFVGNSSLAGCVSWLTNEKEIPTKDDISSVKIIDLAGSEQWLQLFTEHMMFEGGNA
jgi:uncharacterized 2Fe-2S/4Fe-4S cluster protein (DUF4445 family)